MFNKNCSMVSKTGFFHATWVYYGSNQTHPHISLDLTSRKTPTIPNKKYPISVQPPGTSKKSGGNPLLASTAGLGAFVLGVGDYHLVNKQNLVLFSSPWVTYGWPSKNKGLKPPKSSILIGFSIINHPFWGTRIFGNTHIINPIGYQ